MTVKETIEQLKKLPEDAPVFFDCPYCFRSSSLGHLAKVERVEATASLRK